jgi:hypothetical protein
VTEFLAGNGMKIAPHPPYSPDLAPCDFYRFGYIKYRLAGEPFEEPVQPLQVFDAFFPSIEEATLERLFQEWMAIWAQYCEAVGG